jgi:hypothetical protein
MRRTVVLFAGGVAVAGLLVAPGCRSTTGLTGGVVDTGSADISTPIAPAQIVAYGKPLGLSVTQGGLRSAMLTWSAPTEHIYRYRIERSEAPDGPFAWVADVPAVRLTFTDGLAAEKGLRDSTAYYYRICSIFDKFGLTSEPTPPVKTVTAPPPEPPPAVQAEATGSRAVTVAWSLPPSEGVTAYRVERTAAAQPTAFEKVAEVSDPKFVDGGTPASTLKDSTAYLYRVVSVNRVGAESGPSASAEVTTLPPPKPPLKLAAVAAEVRCVPLSWEASPEDDVVRYDVYQARTSEGPFKKIGQVSGRTTTTYIDGGANPGTLEDEGTYFYRVRAVNAVTAESADSETVRALTRPVPPEVQQVTAVSARPREVPVSWGLSADNTVVGYEVWRTVVGADEWTQVARLSRRDITSFLDRGGEKDGTKLGRLLDGTEYLYKVIAFNTANIRSSASASVKARTKLIPVPPAGLEVTTNLATLVRLTWRPNPEPDVNGYLVESSKRPDSGFRKLALLRVGGGAALTADETDLSPNETRYYRIRALDREGLESEWSAAAEGRSKALPDAPTALAVQPDGNTFELVWQPPAQQDVTQYKVWSKRLFGWDLIATTLKPQYRLELADLAKVPIMAVSAVDKDKLESEKSAAVKVAPLAQ